MDAVGQQDEDFALGFGVAQAVDAGGDGVADGGAVFEHSGLEAVHLEEEPFVVGGEGGQGVGHGREGDQADAVVGAVAHELGDDFLGGVEARKALGARGEVVGVHGGGGVDEQDDVHAFGAGAGFGDAAAGTGGGQYEEDERKGGEGRRQPAEEDEARGGRQGRQGGGVGEVEGGAAAGGVEEVRRRGDEEKQEEKPGVCEGNHGWASGDE